MIVPFNHINEYRGKADLKDKYASLMLVEDEFNFMHKKLEGAQGQFYFH